MMQAWLSEDFTLTKRHLGLLLVAGGIMLLVAIAGMELIRTGGFGTLQKLGTLLGVLSIVIGVTLWPLGDQPA